MPMGHVPPRPAARQIELFTGLEPDRDAMRAIMRKALSPLTKAFDDDEGETPYPQPKKDEEEKGEKEEGEK